MEPRRWPPRAAARNMSTCHIILNVLIWITITIADLPYQRATQPCQISNEEITNCSSASSLHNAQYSHRFPKVASPTGSTLSFPDPSTTLKRPEICKYQNHNSHAKPTLVNPSHCQKHYNQFLLNGGIFEFMGSY